MADESYNTVKTYWDTNINTNNTNSITGALHNTAGVKIINGMAGKLFDTTRPYKVGQVVTKNDATFGYEEWVCSTDVAAGSWDSSKFTRLKHRTEKITASDTPYTGVELGVQTYSHNLGHTDFIALGFESTGKEIPLDIRAKSSTKLTIYSAQNYSNAVVYIIEVVIS